MKHRPYLSKTASLLDSTDWSRTPLGPAAGWPKSLHGFVSMIMAMPTPAIIFWGPDLTQIYNDGYAQIMGPRHPRHFGAPYRACWPETYSLIFPWMQRVLDHAEVVEVERERIPLTRLGFDEDAYFTFSFTPLRDDDGRIAGIFQPVFEVTESVLAERRAHVLSKLSSLPESPALWAEATKILTEADEDIAEAVICEVDDRGKTSVLAATPTQVLGCLGAEALSRLVSDGLAVVPTGSAGQPRAYVLPLEAGDTRAVRRILVARTNPRLPENAAYIQFLEMVAAALSSAVKRAEAAAAEERQRANLDRLFMQAPAGIAVLRGPQHTFELVNPLYGGLIGHRDVRGLPLSQALPELDGQPFLGILDRVYRTGEPYVGLAEPALLSRTPGAATEQVYLNYVYQPLHDAEQRPEGVLVFCYEVTEQVLARQRSEQLAQALRQEHQRKDEFLAMLAHELRNPLAPVKSAADLLMRAPTDARIVAHASEIISRQVVHLSGLINDLLDVSRVTRGLVKLNREPESLRAVLLDAAEQVQPLVEARSHRLLIDLPAQEVFVLGDRKRLVQVFSNLLNNAAKFTPDGGQITLGLQASEGHAVVTIADTGVGIDADLLPRVFDLFVQGESGAAHAAGGLGIGLALSRTLLEMHGGSIKAHSAGVRLGSRFEVRLPSLDAPTHQPASDVIAGAVPRGNGQPVLVVDDNVDAAQMLALQIEDAGYQVDVTHSGHGAIRAHARRRYLACLVDMGLPDLHGMEVAARVKSGGGDQPLLIAVSGYGQQSDVNLAHEAGFDHYFVKPVDVTPLIQLLHDREGRWQEGAQQTEAE